MKLADLQSVAAANIRQTYTTLGTSIDQSVLSSEEGFSLCLSPTPHPICNFAIDLNLNPWAARKLAALASEREAFCVYRIPGDQPEHAPELLERVGFKQTYELTVMVGPGEERGEAISLVLADDPIERLAIGRFMSGQFFFRQTDEFRQTVAIATANATDLSLFSVMSGQQRIAALMVSDLDSVGLYNLCVHPSFRGLGWGTSAVQAIMSLAAKSGRQVTLQCESDLVPWYQLLGFEVIGAVQVYNLAEWAKADIIQMQ